MQASISIPNELTTLARLFADAGFPLYAVGGMVRNALLGLPVHDMDITSAMRMEDVRTLCAQSTAAASAWNAGPFSLGVPESAAARRMISRSTSTSC